MSCKKDNEVLFWRQDQQDFQRKKKNHRIKYPEWRNEANKRRWHHLPSNTPRITSQSTETPLTKPKNRKLWSKIVLQIVKSDYSRWSRWSMPHNDRKKKRLRNVTVCFEAPKMYTNQLNNICNRVVMELQYLQLYQRYASLQVLFKIFAQIRFYRRLRSEKAVDAKGFEWKSNCTETAIYTSDFKHKIYCNIYIYIYIYIYMAKPGQAVYFTFSRGVFRTLSNV